MSHQNQSIHEPLSQYLCPFHFSPPLNPSQPLPGKLVTVSWWKLPCDISLLLAVSWHLSCTWLSEAEADLWPLPSSPLCSCSIHLFQLMTLPPELLGNKALRLSNGWCVPTNRYKSGTGHLLQAVMEWLHHSFVLIKDSVWFKTPLIN